MGPSGRPEPRRSGRAPIEAVTTDFWFTLCYAPALARRRVEADRCRAWSDPLRAAGIDAAARRRHLRALERWNDSQQRRGHAPSIARQSEWLAARTGAVIDAAAVTRQLESSLRAIPVRPAPGVRAALAKLHDRGIRLGLVSNLVNESSASAEEILRALGLHRYYAARLFSPDLPWSKPDPRPFRRCLRELGATPRTSVHVGDRAIDRLGARSAGMRAIVYTGLHRVEFGAVVPRADRPPIRAVRAESWEKVLRLLEPELA